MSYTHRFYGSMFIGLMVHFALCADFFLFRTLTHPTTHKVVVLLYDIHASAVENVTLYNKIVKEAVPKIIDEAIQKRDAARRGRGALPISTIQKMQNTLLDQLDEQCRLLYGCMPHLSKQHADLSALIASHQISLIVEDGGDPQEKRITMTIGAPSYKFYSYFQRIAGTSKLAGSTLYQEEISPMLGIGKSITGSFSALRFMPVGKAYFYNPDARGGSIALGSSEEVNRITIEAIDTLFSKYGQAIVVVAEGYKHIMAIAETLIQRGYHAGKPHMSKDLLERRSKEPVLREFLDAIVRNDAQAEDNLLSKQRSLVYDLIASPLDISALFAAGLLRDSAVDDELRSLQEHLTLIHAIAH